MNWKYQIVIGILLLVIGFVLGQKSIKSDISERQTEDSLYLVIDSMLISQESKLSEERVKNKVILDSIRATYSKDSIEMALKTKQYSEKYEKAKYGSIDSVKSYTLDKLSKITIP